MVLVPLREPKGSVERKQGEKSQIKHRRIRSAMGCLGLSPGSPLRCHPGHGGQGSDHSVHPMVWPRQAGARGQAAITGSPITPGVTPIPSQPLMEADVSLHAPWAARCPPAAAFGLAPCRMWLQMLVLSPSPRTPPHCSCEPLGCPPLHLGAIESPRSLLSS